MATHEQTFLGPVLEALEAEGYLTLEPDTNSWAVAARLCEMAAEDGITIDASPACDDCAQEEADDFTKREDAIRVLDRVIWENGPPIMADHPEDHGVSQEVADLVVSLRDFDPDDAGARYHR